MVIEGLDELSKTIETNVKQYKKAVESVMPTINNAFESFQSSMKGLDCIITPLIEHLKYNILVPPKVYDFLVKMRVPLSIDEIKRVNNMRMIIEDSNYKGKELTPHNGKEKILTSDIMIRNYLLHILQFGNPQERVRISEGIKSKFILSNRRLVLQ